MEGTSGEFQDWEMLHNSDDGLVLSSDDDSRDFGDIEVESEGVIRLDYFALDSGKRYGRTVAESDRTDEGSVESDNPSWVDPGSDPMYGVHGSNEVGFQGIAFRRKTSSEFWSDSSSDGPVSRKDSDGENVLGFSDDGKTELVLQGTEESDEGRLKNTVLGNFWMDSGVHTEVTVKADDAEAERNLSLDDTGITGEGLVLSPEMETGDRLDLGMVVERGEAGGGSGSTNFVEGQGTETTEGIGKTEMIGSFATEPVISSGRDSPPSGEKRGMVWWKLPLELLKFCVFRVSPVWSVSIAAAVMGFVIMRRRLHKMKQKSQSLALKVTIEDKKVSQFMTRAARLNEAFSVVRRVPVIRPSLPTGGVTPWPVMTLR